MKSWGDVTAKYIKGRNINDVFHCPDSSSTYGYAFNQYFDCFSQSGLQHPGNTVILIESDSSVLDSFGGSQLLASKKRHGGYLNFAFADGHVKMLPRELYSTLEWRTAR